MTTIEVHSMSPELERQFVERLIASGMVERVCACGTWFLTRDSSLLCPPCRQLVKARRRSELVEAIREDAQWCRRLGEFNNARLCEEVALVVERGDDLRPLGQNFRGLERDP